MNHTREEQLKAFERLLDVMDELREKCPWDRKQTNQSLRANTIEETYELCEALMNEDRKNIYVEMAFDTRLFNINAQRKPRQMLEDMIHHGLHATVSASGVTGLSRIELNFPKGELEEEKPSWRPEHPLIPPAPSILQSAEDSAKQILNQLNKMDFCAAYSNLLSIARSANTSLENFNAVLTAEQGGISEIVQNVRDASNSLRDFADQIRSNPSSILRSYTPGELPETKR